MTSFRVSPKQRRVILFFLATIITATMCNFSQWNYLFVPPSLNSMIEDFKSIDSIGYYNVKLYDNASGYKAVNGNTTEGEYGFFATASEFIIEYDGYRVSRWAHLQGIERITLFDDLTLTQLEMLIAQVDWSTEFLPDVIMSGSTQEQSVTSLPVGYAIRGQNTNDQTLILINMIHLISDDSYSYHEALFQLSDGDVIVLETNKYNYDVAGIEFAQWPFWFLFTFFGWYVLLLILMLISNLLNHKRVHSPQHAALLTSLP